MDRYQMVKKIGQGSFGTALLCRSKRTGEQVVIKRVDVRDMPEEERRGAIKEATILAQLRHPAIIRHVESFEDAGFLCIVTEYAARGDLSMCVDARKGAPFPEAQVLGYFVQLALALYYLHKRRILHRDLKLQNVFLTADDEVRLGDFGIARVLRHTMECARTVVGTPYYLSPELCENKPYNHKSDVWSLGCILYELCALKHAFDGSSITVLVRKILRGRFEPIPSCFSPSMASLVDAMLQLKPSHRPSVGSLLSLPVLRPAIRSYVARVGERRAVLPGIDAFLADHPVLPSGMPPPAAPSAVAMEPGVATKRTSRVSSRASIASLQAEDESAAEHVRIQPTAHRAAAHHAPVPVIAPAARHRPLPSAAFGVVPAQPPEVPPPASQLVRAFVSAVAPGPPGSGDADRVAHAPVVIAKYVSPLQRLAKARELDGARDVTTPYKPVPELDMPVAVPPTVVQPNVVSESGARASTVATDPIGAVTGTHSMAVLRPPAPQAIVIRARRLTSVAEGGGRVQVTAGVPLHVATSPDDRRTHDPAISKPAFRAAALLDPNFMPPKLSESAAAAAAASSGDTRRLLSPRARILTAANQAFQRPSTPGTAMARRAGVVDREDAKLMEEADTLLPHGLSLHQYKAATIRTLKEGQMRRALPGGEPAADMLQVRVEGATFALPRVTRADPLTFRLEALRTYLADVLTDDVLIRLYQSVQQARSDPATDAPLRTLVNDALHREAVSEVSAPALLYQLIRLEDVAFAH